MRVAVIGGGVAGLAAAWRASAGGAEVVLIESAARFGGQIHTERVADCIVEHGAEGFVARSATVPALCRRVGLREDLQTQTTTRTLGLDEGRLFELEPGEADRIGGIQAHPAAWGHGLTSLRRGMGSLCQRLIEGVAPTNRVRGLVRHLTRIGGPRGGWRIDVGTSDVEADAVILALPVRPLLTVVAELLPEADTFLHTVDLVSTVSVAFVMRTEDIIHPLDASGFVVSGLQRTQEFRGCTFASSKFAGRAPEGRCVIRAFFRPEHGAAHGSEYWIEEALACLSPVLAIRGEPLIRRVAYWPEAIPHYRPGHDASVARVRAELRRLGLLEVVGAAVTRSGVDGAVRSGLQAAERLVSLLTV